MDDDAEDTSWWADKPRIMQTARDMLDALMRGEGQEALDLLRPLQFAELQFVTWALGTSFVAAARGGGMTDMTVLQAFDEVVDDAITEDVERGLGELDENG